MLHERKLAGVVIANVLVILAAWSTRAGDQAGLSCSRLPREAELEEVANLALPQL